MKTLNFYFKNLVCCLIILSGLQGCKKNSYEPLDTRKMLEANQGASDYLVSTVAGNGELGANYIDGPIVTARLGSVYRLIAGSDGKIYFGDSYFPQGLRVIQGDNISTLIPGIGNVNTRDKDGNFYIGNFYLPAIRKISATGISILAGCESIYGHVDGKGSQARFSHVESVIAAEDSSIYVGEVATSSNVPTPENVITASYIRKIGPDGTVTTIAGGPYGDLDGQGTNARFRAPLQLAISPDGSLFIVTENALLKMTTSGVVTTIKKFGGRIKDGSLVASEISNMSSITIGPDRALYFTQTYVRMGDVSNVIRKISTEGLVTTIAGGDGEDNDIDGPGDIARFSYPYGLVYSSYDNALYFSDSGNYKIKKITLPN